VANLYTYEVIGVAGIERVSLIANSQKHAEKKLAGAKLDGKNFAEFRLLTSHKFDDKVYL
jgi:hypothetical protein